MSQSVAQPVDGSKPVQNGSIITFVTEAGYPKTRAPDVNQYVASGTMNVALSGRFNPYYYICHP